LEAAIVVGKSNVRATLVMIVVKAFIRRDFSRNSCTTWQWLYSALKQVVQWDYRWT